LNLGQAEVTSSSVTIRLVDIIASGSIIMTDTPLPSKNNRNRVGSPSASGKRETRFPRENDYTLSTFDVSSWYGGVLLFIRGGFYTARAATSAAAALDDIKQRMDQTKE
jgi:hypothetical protein